MNKVETYYDAHVEAEWTRLSRNKLEFGTTCRVLARFLPRGARVLDVGGGPGRYSFHLAAAGYAVTLYDLSAGNIEFARRHALEAGVDLEGAIQGNVLDLGARGLGAFDAVLCMGPLYHLLGESERVRAVEACLSVLRPGGILVAAFISCFAPLLETMRNRMPEFVKERDVNLGFLGDGHLVLPPGSGFTDAFLIRPDAISPFMARFPIQELLVTAAEGLPSQTERAIYEQGEEALETALDIIEWTGTDSLTWGASDHFLYVGRKR